MPFDGVSLDDACQHIKATFFVESRQSLVGFFWLWVVNDADQIADIHIEIFAESLHHVQGGVISVLVQQF